MLSQGPDDSAWFEHRMLAEEMGVPLVRSTELFVDDGRVSPDPATARGTAVDVIYLRMDEDSLVHSPGADGHAARAEPAVGRCTPDTVTLANALGNGVGDDKAMYAYVPELIELLPRREAAAGGRADLPVRRSPEQRAEVLDRLDELVCKPVDGYGGDRSLIGPHATRGGAGRGPAADRRRPRTAGSPRRWSRLSTHPAFDGHRLAPRHVDLRAFVFTGGDVAWSRRRR